MHVCTTHPITHSHRHTLKQTKKPATFRRLYPQAITTGGVDLARADLSMARVSDVNPETELVQKSYYRPPFFTPGGAKPAPTTTKEWRSWYLYDCANGAFFYGVANFLPIIVLDQARAMAQSTFCADLVGTANATVTSLCETGLLDGGRGGIHVDYYTSGECLGVIRMAVGNAITFAECEAQGGTWSPDWKSEAAMVNLFGFLPVNYASAKETGTTSSILCQLLCFMTLSGNNLNNTS